MIFYQLGVLFVGVLAIRALLVGVHIRARDFWKKCQIPVGSGLYSCGCTPGYRSSFCYESFLGDRGPILRCPSEGHDQEPYQNLHPNEIPQHLPHTLSSHVVLLHTCGFPKITVGAPFWESPSSRS